MYEMIYISISTKRTTLFNVCTYLIGLHRSWTDLHECNTLRDLVPYVQFKKREKHPWWSFTFCKVVCFTVTLLHDSFFTYSKLDK